jgi:hypothetical protein
MYSLFLVSFNCWINFLVVVSLSFINVCLQQLSMHLFTRRFAIAQLCLINKDVYTPSSGYHLSGGLKLLFGVIKIVIIIFAAGIDGNVSGN